MVRESNEMWKTDDCAERVAVGSDLMCWGAFESGIGIYTVG
jgi:hypothetical protein